MSSPLALLLVDDEAVRSAILFAHKVEGITTQVCTEDDDFASWRAGTCLVIDQTTETHDLLERIQGLKARGCALPIIVLLSGTSRPLRRRLAALGATVVEKPLLGNELATTILTLTGGSALQ